MVSVPLDMMKFGRTWFRLPAFERQSKRQWSHRYGWQTAERALLLVFGTLAVILLAVLIGLINQQVERGKSLRMEQISQLEALNTCHALAGAARQECRQRAIATTSRLPLLNDDAADAVAAAATPLVAARAIALSRRTVLQQAQGAYQ